MENPHFSISRWMSDAGSNDRMSLFFTSRIVLTSLEDSILCYSLLRASVDQYNGHVANLQAFIEPSIRPWFHLKPAAAQPKA
jgi:hypothetical protein